MHPDSHQNCLLLIGVDRQEVLDRDLQQMVDDYAAQVPDGPKLRIEDLEFVQRYCRGLSEDIEW